MRDRTIWTSVLLTIAATSVLVLVLVLLWGWSGATLGTAIAAIATIIVVSMARFDFSPEENGRVHDLYELGRAFSLKMVRVEGARSSLRIPADALFSIEVHKDVCRPEEPASYGISWRGLGLLLIIAPLVTGVGAILSILVCLYALGAVERSFARMVHPFLESELPRYNAPKDDIGQLLRFSLAEASQIASEAEKVRISRYEDALILSLFFVGFTGGLVEYIVFSNILGGFSPTALVLAIIVSLGLTFISLLLVRRLVVPRMKKAGDWVARLELAKAREEAGFSADGESAIGLLIEASAEMPGWLRDTEKGRIESSAAIWIVAFFLAIPAVTMLMSGVNFLIIGSGPNQFGALMLAAGAGLLAITYLVYRILLRQERWRSDVIRRDWETRQQYLKKRLEEIVEGM